jgi:hypothetical protein
MKRLLATAILLALLMPAVAVAQQRTIYGADGKAVARSTVDTQGTVTTYGADGRVISRESNTHSGTTIYDGPSGRVVGKVTKERR